VDRAVACDQVLQREDRHQDRQGDHQDDDVDRVAGPDLAPGDAAVGADHHVVEVRHGDFGGGDYEPRRHLVVQRISRDRLGLVAAFADYVELDPPRRGRVEPVRGGKKQQSDFR
jgi:hypothetical protein